MVASGAAKPAASSRNIAPASMQAAAPSITRIKNAKELRKAYVELNQSPDGADPDPLTIPKCVECNHCGWPVYPRESKIATKKTFARAGIERGTKTEEDEKARKAKAEAGEAEDDAGSTDSRDTVERQADEIEDLKDSNEALEKKNQELDAQNELLTKELDETKEALAAAEERIEFLEEAELRWRDKLSQARMEIDRLKTVIERASMVSNDREAGLCKTLLELRDLREKHEAFVRRRNFMLRELEQRYAVKELEEAKGIVLRMWRTEAVNTKLKRKLEDLEVRRQREVRELNVQLHVEREQVQNLREHRERLVARLKEAGQRLLRRSLGCDHWPSAKDHAFRALVAVHPVNALENALEFCQAELERVNNDLAAMTDRAEHLQEERDELARERDGLAEKLKKVEEELAYLKDQIGGSIGEMEARRQAMEEERRKFREELERWKQKLKDLQDAFEEEREAFETQIRMLESRLAVAEAAAMAKLGGSGEDDDPSRVVPKGQGVVCVSCLKQLVHRGVKPLPPVAALEVTNSKLDKAKKEFFAKELSGVINPDDELHDYVYNARKDPYGLARLTLHPPGGAITSPQSPTTGLPALKRKGFGGSATELRASMREFRPRNFR
mmetsp:Transcript_86822/g.226616  ORF Transcript_86822/g.226616 Transcript_86822/m.226616 type:complete len:616 (-) Transcript_86822:71-1918(-)